MGGAPKGELATPAPDYRGRNALDLALVFDLVFFAQKAKKMPLPLVLNKLVIYRNNCAIFLDKKKPTVIF